MRLYQIVSQIIENQHEEVNTDQLDALTLAFEVKAIGCACVVKNLTAEVNAIESEIRRLQDLRAARQNNVDRLKAYLMSCMKAAGIEKVENGIHKLRIQKSPLSVTVIDEQSVPPEFKTEVRSVQIDRKAIAEHIKTTGEIPDGISALIGEHLRIS